MIRLGTVLKTRIEKNIFSLPGREPQFLTVYPQPARTACTHCDYNSIEGEAGDPNCSVCGGDGWVETEGKPIHIICRLQWVRPEEKGTAEIGAFEFGQCRVLCRAYYRKRIEEASRILVPVGRWQREEMQVMKDANRRLKILPKVALGGNLDLVQVFMEKRPID